MSEVVYKILNGNLMLAQLSDDQLRGAFRTAGDETRTMEGYVSATRQRCEEVSAMYDPSKERLPHQKYEMDLELAKIIDAQKKSQAQAPAGE